MYFEHMFEGVYPAEVEALLDRQLSDRYANEITEAEWVQDLLDAERRREITSLSDAEAIAELIEVEWLPRRCAAATPGPGGPPRSATTATSKTTPP